MVSIFTKFYFLDFMLVFYYCTEMLKKYVKNAQIRWINLKAEHTIKRNVAKALIKY